MDHLTYAQLLSNYGEFISALAVVATLAYLSIQVRQQNLESQAKSVHEILGGFRDAQAVFGMLMSRNWPQKCSTLRVLIH
jgi:hypothetical protein